jgi:hypothetical protein
MKFADIIKTEIDAITIQGIEFFTLNEKKLRTIKEKAPI